MRLIGLPPLPPSLTTDAELASNLQELLLAGVPVPDIPQPQNPLPPGLTITASSTADPGTETYQPWRVYDGNPATFWANAFIVPTAQAPQIITIDYGVSYAIEGYRLRRVGAPGQYPVSWDIFTSQDGVEWVLRDSQRNTPLVGGGNPDTLQVFWNRPLRRERYIRLSAISLGGGGSFVGIAEFSAITNPASLLEPGFSGLSPNQVDFAGFGVNFGSSPAGFWLDPSRPQYTTSTLTTVATTDGQAVLNSPDYSGSGASLSNTANGPTYRLVSGVPVLEFSGSASLFRTHTTRTVTACTFACCFRHANASAAFLKLLGFSTAGSTSLPFISSRWTTGEYRVQGLTANNQFGVGHTFDNNWHTLVISFAGGRIRGFYDGAEFSGEANSWTAPSPANASFDTDAYRVADGLGSGVQIAEMFFTETASGFPAEMAAAIDRYFRAKRPALFQSSPQVLWVGNSLSTMGFVSAAQAIPSLVHANRVTDFELRVAARGGATATSWLGKVEELKRLIRGAPICFLWENRNELVLTNNTLPETLKAQRALDRLQELANTLLRMGCRRVILGNCLPSNSLVDATRLSYNSLLSALVASDARLALCDVAAEPQMGAAGANANATLYLDGVHPTAAGNALLAPIIRSSIEALI